jgi:prepilin-type processing-associated H-X9-DG protein
MSDDQPQHRSNVPTTLEYASKGILPRVRLHDRPWFIGSSAVLLFALMLSGVIMLMQPSRGGSRETANRVKCASNLRQIGAAMKLYAEVHGGRYPYSLETLILQHNGLGAVQFQCPTSNDEQPPHRNPEELAAILAAKGRPDSFALAASRPWTYLSYIYVAGGLGNDASPDAILMYEPICNHDGDGATVLFGDGHVEFLEKRYFRRIVAELQAGHNPPRAEMLQDQAVKR